MFGGHAQHQGRMAVGTGAPEGVFGDRLRTVSALSWLPVLAVCLLTPGAPSGSAARADAGDGFGQRQWQPWCETRGDLGWHFYCDPDKTQAPPEPSPETRAEAEIETEPAPDPQPDNATSTSAFTSATARITAMRAHLQELRALAVIEPTHEHVEAYMREQARMSEMAGLFADRWRRVLWATPDLDYETHHPQTNLAKKAVQADLHSVRQAMMASLHERYGLIYVGTKRCPVCRIYGPHLRAFAGRWKLTVLAVSADGSALAGWPEAVPDDGRLARMNVRTPMVPLTALFDRADNTVTLLGIGFLAGEELIHRIHTLTSQETGDAF